MHLNVTMCLVVYTVTKCKVLWRIGKNVSEIECVGGKDVCIDFLSSYWERHMRGKFFSFLLFFSNSLEWRGHLTMSYGNNMKSWGSYQASGTMWMGHNGGRAVPLRLGALAPCRSSKTGTLGFWSLSSCLFLPFLFFL